VAQLSCNDQQHVVLLPVPLDAAESSTIMEEEKKDFERLHAQGKSKAGYESSFSSN